MSGFYIEQAARVGDGIEHTGADWAFGLSVVFLAGGFMMMGPLSVAGVAGVFGTAGFAQSIGGRIDSALPKEVTEYIKEGASTVFMDEACEAAAKAHPETTLTGHSGHWVTKGSDVVHIEGFNASRIGDPTSCAGKVARGSETIFIGGVSVFAPGAPESPNEVVGSDAYQYYDLILRWGGYASIPSGTYGRITHGIGFVNDQVLQSPEVKNALAAQGAATQAVTNTASILERLGM